ncbi:uncharacterized protein LOC119191617 isoform X1 [Manduca sexta]|uniref:uncharacterized protein LOC119191617 isoform X1 n=1 Tax=Manduca sexta TaxID=7130 RepID=UPI001890A37E|nr:uncharacterized protein LOC119191617 isoform X1 [Manduca sexta]
MRHAGVYATTARAAKFAQCTYCKQRDFCGLFDKSRSDKAAPVRSDSYVHGQLGQAYSEKTILVHSGWTTIRGARTPAERTRVATTAGAVEGPGAGDGATRRRGADHRAVCHAYYARAVLL